MLHHPITRWASACLVSLGAALSIHGQVQLSTSIDLTGPDTLRQLKGLGRAMDGQAVVSVEGAVTGIAHWCTAALSNGNFVLSHSIPQTEVLPGALVRFLAPSQTSGAVALVHAGDTLPLLRSDGLAPERGRIRPGSVVEAIRGVDRWVLLGSSSVGCPLNSLAVNERVCIDITHQTSTFMNAVSFCESRGGRLCTWEEWHLACVQWGTQLQGIYSAWEWVDDTANHDHHAVQVGLGDCFNQRSLSIATSAGSSKGRCCYSLR